MAAAIDTWKHRYDATELADHLEGWTPHIGNPDLRADLRDAADALRDLDDENQSLLEGMFL